MLTSQVGLGGMGGIGGSATGIDGQQQFGMAGHNQQMGIPGISQIFGGLGGKTATVKQAGQQQQFFNRGLGGIGEFAAICYIDGKFANITTNQRGAQGLAGRKTSEINKELCKDWGAPTGCTRGNACRLAYLPEQGRIGAGKECFF